MSYNFRYRRSPKCGSWGTWSFRPRLLGNQSTAGAQGSSPLRFSLRTVNLSRNLMLTCPVFRSSMHCDRYLKESEGSARSRLGERASLSERDEREARYWTRKLYAFEANDPDRSVALLSYLVLIAKYLDYMDSTIAVWIIHLIWFYQVGS